MPLGCMAKAPKAMVDISPASLTMVYMAVATAPIRAVFMVLVPTGMVLAELVAVVLMLECREQMMAVGMVYMQVAPVAMVCMELHRVVPHMVLLARTMVVA